MFPFSLFSSSKAFAVDVTDGSLQLLEVRGNGKLHVRSSMRLDLPKGIVEDGKILDQPKFAEQLRKAFEKATPRPPKTHAVVSALPESQTFSIHVSIDRKIDRKKVPEAILEQAEQLLPVRSDECVYDYILLSTTASTYEILFVAALSATVETYKNAMKLAGLDLRVLEPESLALGRAVVTPSMLAPKQAVMVVAVGSRSFDLIFFDADGMQLSVTVPVPTAIQAESAAAPELPAKKAPKTRKKTAETVAAERTVAVHPLLIDEVKRAIDHYQQKTGRTVSKGLLTGEQKAMTEWQEKLGSALAVPFEIATPQCASEGGTPQRMFVACGLATRAATLSQGLNLITS